MRQYTNSLPVLLVMRFIWAALLLGQLAFMAILALLLGQNNPQLPVPPPARVQSILLTVNVAMLLTIVPIMFFIRRVILRRSIRSDGTLSLTAYGAGNIIFWAGCEGVSFFGLAIVFLDHSFWPAILCVIAAMVLQAAAIPRRSALEIPSDPYQIYAPGPPGK